MNGIRDQKKLESAQNVNRPTGIEKKRIKHKIRHGKRYTRRYEIWCGMKKRCYNSNCDRFKDYGGRGIKICEEWKDNFISFWKWSNVSGYKSNLTIDRINNDGNYSPQNCRWSDYQTQVMNSRNPPIKIEYQSQTKTIKEWSELTNISIRTIKTRIKSKWPIHRIFEPIKKQYRPDIYATHKF